MSAPETPTGPSYATIPPELLNLFAAGAEWRIAYPFTMKPSDQLTVSVQRFASVLRFSFEHNGQRAWVVDFYAAIPH